VRASIHSEPPADGAWLDGADIVVRGGNRVTAVLPRDEILLRGEHNLANVVMACAIGNEAGFPVGAMARAVRGFRGVAHRLEVVGSALGATWINDSIATSPERTVAGLRAFTEPVVLLLGGREKSLPLEGLRELARERCRAVICFGESGGLFADGIRDAVPDTRLVATLEDAIASAATAVQPGDVVLLSPAGTSFDAYPNFEARGVAFRRLVAALPGFRAEVQP
jgi:UDP-N-acetylmuramoylalanine--D-glutamate ligase